MSMLRRFTVLLVSALLVIAFQRYRDWTGANRNYHQAVAWKDRLSIFINGRSSLADPPPGTTLMNFINHRHGVRSSTLRLVVLLLASIASLPAWAAAHFLTLINDDMRTVVEVDAAPTGTDTWSPLDLGGPLVGGSSGQAVVRFASAVPCKEDLRVIYRDGAPLTITGFDVCRTPTLHLGRARAMAERHTEAEGH